MSRILHSRFFRCLVCLVIICCILVASSPFRVQATSAGLAGVITGAASVSVSAPMVIGATLIALGLSAGINGTAGLEAVVDSAVSHLESAGEFIKDGAVELIRTVDEAGSAAYYVAGEMMDDLRSWIYDANVFIDQRDSYPVGTKITLKNGDYLDLNTPARLITFVRTSSYNYSSYDLHQWVVSLADSNLLYYLNGSAEQSQGVYISWDGTFYRVYKSVTTIYDSNIARLYTNLADFNSSASLGNAVAMALNAGFFGFYPLTDISLGYLPSSDTTLDETTVVTFHPYLADVQRFKRSGGSGDSGDGDDKTKWYLRLALGATTAAVMATTQQQQIENPSVDIEEITWGVQFDVTETTDPDDENKKVHLLTPQIGTGTDPGTGTNPDTGDGSGDNTGSDTGTDTGNSGNTGSSWKPPSDHSQFALTDLSKFFPFCIPFDLFDFFTLLNADPVAPSFSWQIQDLSGQTYALTVDLSQWDSVAQLFRRLQLFLFVCGLAAASRKYIKW